MCASATLSQSLGRLPTAPGGLTLPRKADSKEKVLTAALGPQPSCTPTKVWGRAAASHLEPRGLVAIAIPQHTGQQRKQTDPTLRGGRWGVLQTEGQD